LGQRLFDLTTWNLHACSEQSLSAATSWRAQRAQGDSAYEGQLAARRIQQL
jgi:hypothetical protein